MRRGGSLALAAGLLLAGCAADPAPLLWEVAGAQGTLQLLGTIHLGIAARGDLPEVAWERFDAAGTLVAEAEIRNVDQQAYRKLASLPPGTTLDSLLRPKTWSALLDLVDDVPAATLKQLRPWAVTSEVFRKIAPAGEGMDLTLLNEADRQLKGLAFLETWQDQVAALNTQPLKQDAADLAELIDNHEQVRAAYLALLERYRAGDAAEVERLAPAAWAVPATSDPLFDPFIRQRNLTWLPQIEARLAAPGQTFVAVGFGHLLGAEGVLKLLGDKGHAVTRVE